MRKTIDRYKHNDSFAIPQEDLEYVCSGEFSRDMRRSGNLPISWERRNMAIYYDEPQPLSKEPLLAFLHDGSPYAEDMVRNLVGSERGLYPLRDYERRTTSSTQAYRMVVRSIHEMSSFGQLLHTTEEPANHRLPTQYYLISEDKNVAIKAQASLLDKMPDLADRVYLLVKEHYLAGERSVRNFDATTTAKGTCAAVYLTSKPFFWQKRLKRGNRATPLIKGNHAEIFVSDEDLDALKERPDFDKLQAVSIRNRWINKVFEEYIKQHKFTQILILGSGFDTRAYKKNPRNQLGKSHSHLYASVKFFEVDDAKILDEKERIFKDKNLDKNATYIRADYTKENFLETLKTNGLDLKLPTLIIWEGNLMYLEKEAGENLIKLLKSSFENFAITFDYFSQTFLDNNEKTKAIWKTGIDNIEHFAENHQLTIVNTQSLKVLAKEYEVDNNPTDDLSFYSVCTLRR